MENETEDTLPRTVAKWLIRSVIAYKTGELTANAAADYTRFEKDSLAVKLGSGAVSMVVTAKLTPHTDKMVDKAADFIVEKRTKYVAKKNTKKKD